MKTVIKLILLLVVINLSHAASKYRMSIFTISVNGGSVVQGNNIGDVRSFGGYNYGLVEIQASQGAAFGELVYECLNCPENMAMGTGTPQNSNSISVFADESNQTINFIKGAGSIAVSGVINGLKSAGFDALKSLYDTQIRGQKLNTKHVLAIKKIFSHSFSSISQDTLDLVIKDINGVTLFEEDKRKAEVSNEAGDLFLAKRTSDIVLERAKRAIDHAYSQGLNAQDNTPLFIAEEAYSRGVSSQQNEQFFDAIDFGVIAKEMADLAIGWDPITGTGRDLYEAITGTNLITGEELSSFDRGMAIFGSLTLGYGSKISKAGKGLKKLAKYFKLSSYKKAIEVAESGIKNFPGKEAAKFVKGIPGLKYTGDGTWVSEAGLIYGRGSRHGNRLRHILKHSKVNQAKSKHTVFDVEVKDIPQLIDEAWSKKSPADLTISPGNLNKVYKVNMNREIGTEGERVIAIVIKKGTANEIITAYPMK